MNICQQILKRINYPTDIIILDFETFYSSQYHMGKGGLPMIEYVLDERFDFLGLALKSGIKLDYLTPRDLSKYANVIRTWCDKCTLIMHNAAFDGLVLKEKFNCYPKYCIDTIALSRYFEARAKHSLEECAIRYGLQPKGELVFAKGKHWGELSPPSRKKLIIYAKNDVEITGQLLEIMLPMLPRPEKELVIMQDLLERAWVPQLEFDFERAKVLKDNMEEQINNKLSEVDWL